MAVGSAQDKAAVSAVLSGRLVYVIHRKDLIVIEGHWSARGGARFFFDLLRARAGELSGVPPRA